MCCAGMSKVETGAGSIVSLGIVAGIIAVTAALALGAGALLTLHRAQSTIDDSALAAADSASGRVAGYPCDRATSVAQEQSLVLDSCQINGHAARVTGTVILFGISVPIRAQAGPPQSG